MVSITVLAFAAAAVAQGVTQRIAPSAPAPAGCSPNYNGQFQISVVNASTAGSSKTKRQNGLLLLNLHDGVLKEQTKGATGYIADNYQFQFDAPPQTGAIYTAGFSACSNGTLALGGSSVFYQCLSGGFYNLYDRHWAAQCEPIFLDIIPYGGAASSAPAVTSTVKSGATGVAKVTTGSASVATQLGDGQPGASSVKPLVSSIAVVSQISDHQPQGPTSVPAVVSQISDHQPQAPTSIPAVVSQISDHQPQAPTSIPAARYNGTATGSPARYTGAADKMAAGSYMAMAAGAVAVALL